MGVHVLSEYFCVAYRTEIFERISFVLHKPRIRRSRSLNTHSLPIVEKCVLEVRTTPLIGAQIVLFVSLNIGTSRAHRKKQAACHVGKAGRWPACMVDLFC